MIYLYKFNILTNLFFKIYIFIKLLAFETLNWQAILFHVKLFLDNSMSLHKKLKEILKKSSEC
jgi:hypothetical protein